MKWLQFLQQDARQEFLFWFSRQLGEREARNVKDFDAIVRTRILFAVGGPSAEWKQAGYFPADQSATSLSKIGLEVINLSDSPATTLRQAGLSAYNATALV